MDFISLLETNCEKLKSKDILNLLWMEMLNEKRSEEYLEQLVEYSFHYPVDSDNYLQELNKTFDELDKEKLSTIDGHLKAYMITFLYYCTNRFSRTVPVSTTILATQLYIKLISIPRIGKYFFETNMFKIQMYTIVTSADHAKITDSQKVYLFKLVKKYCLAEQLDVSLLKGVINMYVGSMVSVARNEVDDIHTVNAIQLVCINSVRDIILNESEGSRIKYIMEGLFKCLGKSIVIGRSTFKDAGTSIIKVCIRDVLQEEIDDDKFQYIIDAFSIYWGRQDFHAYEDAVVIMNVLKVQYYRELLRKMVLFSQSKNHKIYMVNIVHMMIAIAHNPPPFSLEKVQVFYSCVMRNILYHLADSEKRIVDLAIETISKLCLMKDNPLINVVFNTFNCTGKFVNVSSIALLLCVNSVVDEKWGITPRNQNLLVIVAKFLSNSSKINSKLVKKTLQAICKDCTPFSLKPSLSILHELYCVLALKGEDESASEVLKIIFKCAMHQDSNSVDFANHIFNSMLKPSVIDNITYHPKYYFNLFLRSDFQYEALFTKCQKLIKSEQIDQIIRDLNYNVPGGAVLLCCLLEFCKYSEIYQLVNYMINYFNQIATREAMGHLCTALKKIIQNRTITQEDVPQLDLLHSLLLEALFEQTYQVPSIKPAYDLLQQIRIILRIEMQNEILNQLLVVTSERAFRRLHRREVGDHSVFMYLNELCLLMRKPPTQNVVDFLEAYMDNCDRIRELNLYMEDIYLQLLTLFTTMAMMRKAKIPQALRYLEAVLDHESQIVKVLGFKLYYAICQEMTHEFEEVIKFVFREIVVADPCLLKLCIISIEELVYDDYIKLDAETFFKFIHVLGSDDLGFFMKEILLKRFMLSNQSDIAKYYVQSIIYIHVYSKLPDYPISQEFDEALVKMKLRLNNPKDIILFLFKHLSVKKRFNVLHEISMILDEMTRGRCKIDTNFFPVLKDLLMSFRFMVNPSMESKVDKHYYENVCKQIEQKIVKHDAAHQSQNYYIEFEHEIKKCTLSLLRLLFIENRQLTNMIQITLFDALMHWIDFVKDEIITYIHVERGKDYCQYFSKLIHYYNRNKGKFVSPDSCRLPVDRKKDDTHNM